MLAPLRSAHSTLAGEVLLFLFRLHGRFLCTLRLIDSQQFFELLFLLLHFLFYSVRDGIELRFEVIHLLLESRLVLLKQSLEFIDNLLSCVSHNYKNILCGCKGTKKFAYIKIF